jgi:hypothetical protein
VFQQIDGCLSVILTVFGGGKIPLCLLWSYFDFLIFTLGKDVFMFDRLRGQVHHVEVSMDLVIRALIVFEVAASAENANFLIQKRLAVLRLVLLPVRVAPFGSFVELVISFELLLAVREKAICAIHAVAM